MTSTGVDQPRHRTLLYFTAAASEAPWPAAELATCLAPTGGWYTDFHTATDTFVVFADKVSATHGVRPKAVAIPESRTLPRSP